MTEPADQMTMFTDEATRNDETSGGASSVNPDLNSNEQQQSIPRLKPINRNQLIFRTVDIELLIEQEHQARAVWEFVGMLDLQVYEKEIRAVEGTAGSPAIAPQLLVSLWIYAYSRGVSSAREVSRLCGYDPAYQWLTGMEEINHHTLSDFRVNNEEALTKLFVDALGILSAEGLVKLTNVVHDGTKIKAYASGDTFRREKTLLKHLEEAQAYVESMKDPELAENISIKAKKARERAGKEQIERLTLAMEELKKVRESQKGKKKPEDARVSETDPEARIMKHGGGGGYAASYNAQISTDVANGIIVGAVASQAGADYEELEPAVEQIKQNLGKYPERMIVDEGYMSRANIEKMDERSIEMIGHLAEGTEQSAGQMKRRGVDPSFSPAAFKFNPEKNCFLCPADNELRYEGKEKRPGKINFRYRAKASDCCNCAFKDKCCLMNGTKGRTVLRAEEEPAVKAFLERMATEEAKQIYKRRGPVAEFSNAWLKEKFKLRQFRLRGLIKAGLELVWACLAYNIAQWTRLVFKPRLALAGGHSQMR